LPARVSFEKVAAGLTVPERVLLFCLASGTAGVLKKWPGHPRAASLESVTELTPEHIG